MHCCCNSVCIIIASVVIVHCVPRIEHCYCCSLFMATCYRFPLAEETAALSAELDLGMNPRNQILLHCVTVLAPKHMFIREKRANSTIF